MKNMIIDGKRLIELLEFLKAETETETPEDEFTRGCKVGSIAAYGHIIEIVKGSMGGKGAKK